MDYGSRIKGLRSRLGLNQQSFADRIGVSQGTVSRWEQRQQLPSPEALKAMYLLGPFEHTDLSEDVNSSFPGSLGLTVNIVGAIENYKLVDNIEWPQESWISITFPDVIAWRTVPLKAFIVNDNSFSRFYAQGSVVVITPFQLGKIEPRNGDKIIYADRSKRFRYEVTLSEFFVNGGYFKLSGLQMPCFDRSDVSASGGFENLGFIGLVLGGFTIEDPDRLSIPVGLADKDD